MSVMKTEGYATYKNADTDWLEALPEDWHYARIKEIGTVRGRVGWKALKADEYVDEGYIFLATPNIKEKEIDFSNVNYITFERYAESPEIQLRLGDILLTKDGSTLGTANIVISLPNKATVNSSIAVLRIKESVFNKYIYYQILSEFIQKKINLKKSGMGVPHLFQRDINNFFILLPPLFEQTAIVSYLDTKTAQIDQKIELLNQKAMQYAQLKKSLINETVTHGLDKSVQMKASGVDWIGLVPEHWEIQRIGTAFEERSEKVNDTDYPPLSVSMAGIVPQMDSVAKTDNNDNRKRVAIGDYVINSRSDRRGASGISTYDGSVSVISIVLSPKRKFFGKYLHHLFRSYSFIEEFYRVGRGIVDDLWTTRYSVMKSIEFSYPTYDEQKQIADYLDEKTAHIDRIITTINSQIDQLKNLRKTLINDVVTGKIKVIN
ncbi:restriction endonuclease subunit S [Acinetobacter soli]|uniref:restriction endonuclease subunit S n=1 Tax=Acinetobacter soli TaxID=487316 RepID=UPI002813D967|nr:restriction endonuclease subunit S [Acinetobacter soli]MDQ9831488.1 restriction endonuclease subunit S [Acinetobacter soli]